MNRYHKTMVLFSYLLGIIAFIAVLVDDKKNRLYSFHIWQALFLNILIGLITALIYGLWLPQYILTIEIYQRTPFLLHTTLAPFTIIHTILLLLGIMALKEIKFKIPLLNLLAEKIVNRFYKGA